MKIKTTFGTVKIYFSRVVSKMVVNERDNGCRLFLEIIRKSVDKMQPCDLVIERNVKKLIIHSQAVPNTPDYQQLLTNELGKQANILCSL